MNKIIFLFLMAVAKLSVAFDINYNYCDYMKTLHYFASCGKADIVQRMLQRDKTLARGKNTLQSRTTPIVSAIEHGYHDVVRILLEAGAQPDIENNLGWSHPIFEAVKKYLSEDPENRPENSNYSETIKVVVEWYLENNMKMKLAEKELTFLKSSQALLPEPRLFDVIE